MKRKRVKMNVGEIREKIVPILKKYDVTRAALFGSAARGEAGPRSDIDVLVEISNDDLSLLDFVGIKLELEEALGKKVDLVEYSTIKPLLKDKILGQQVPIL